jgi:hypothetical protein
MAEEQMVEEQHIPVVTQIAAILIALQYFKDKIPQPEWESTPLPIIAAPGSWLGSVRDFMGAAADEVPEQIHGCAVVQKDELEWPVLIMHDGKAYRVNDFIDPKTKPEPVKIVLH